MSASSFLKRGKREVLIVVWTIVFVTGLVLLYRRASLPHITDYSITSHQDKSPVVEHRPKDHLIPTNIWQIFLTHKDDQGQVGTIDPYTLGDTASWLAQNPDYHYTLVGSEGADDFVKAHFIRNWSLLQTYDALPNPGLKSDILRYLLLYIKGGVYTDTDTICLKPIDKWIPEQYRNRTRVVVGLEFDKLNGSNWGDIPHDLQFGQWTIAAAPGHRLFSNMVHRAIDSLRDIVVAHNTTLNQLHPTSLEVMNSTGPAAWTDAVFEQILITDSNITDLGNLSGITDPRLYGDILVLPIDGFGMGQPHSNSTNDGTTPEAALIRHMFRGSWRISLAPDQEEAEGEEIDEENSEDSSNQNTDASMEEHKEEFWAEHTDEPGEGAAPDINEPPSP